MGKLIGGLTFFVMLAYGADFFAALIVSIALIALLSGGVWVNEKAESNPQSFAKWYGFAVMAGFVFLAIVFFSQ
mgnify:FL=1